MCVILVCDKSRPTEDMVRNSWSSNNDGGGVAWHGKREDGSPTVKWRKGLTLPEMIKVAAETPLPYIMHFRIASIGGVVDELTHPFPLDAKVPLWLEGDAPDGVLFHNGHWNGWRAYLYDLIFKSGRRLQLPHSFWSDSRAMAFIAYHVGWGVLDWIEGGHRIAIMSPPTEDNPDGIWLFGSWPNRIGGAKEKGGGVLPSNDSWRSKGFRGACDRTYITPPASMAGGGSSGGEGSSSGHVKSAKDSATILLGPGDAPAAGPLPPPSGSPGSGKSEPAVMAGGLVVKALKRLRRGEEKKRRREQRALDRALEKETKALHPAH